MDRPTTILHTADSHIGAQLPVRPRDERPRRGDDFLDSFRRVLAEATHREVDLVIHAGDFFDVSCPGERALVEGTEPILRVASAGIPVVIVPGNHERSIMPAALFLSHPNIHVFSEPRTILLNLRGRKWAISGFPCIRRNAASVFPDALAATRWEEYTSDARVLVVHQAFESAVCGPANFRFRSGDDVVERDVLPCAFDYVAAGHIHRYQALPSKRHGGPPIVYSGSVDRITFAEKDEPKGYVLIEDGPHGLRHRFIEHRVRPMRVKPIAVTGLTREQLRPRIESAIRDLPERAVAQIRLSGTAAVGAMTGLRINTRARSMRPDVLLTATANAIEFEADGVASPPLQHSCAFDCLDAPRERTMRVSTRQVRRLSPERGVYAMHDDDGRLLYVGKATNARSRVRSHLNPKTGDNTLMGWPEQVASIAFRRSYSDLESLLVEAELVRRLRPPFNLQMRKWASYCYLVERDTGVVVQAELSDSGPCFGPFRSRRFALSIAECVGEHFCNTSPRAFLLGQDDTSLRALEAELEQADELTSSPRSQLATVLRSAFEHAALLREAEKLVGAQIDLPGPGHTGRSAFLSVDGVRFDSTAPVDEVRIHPVESWKVDCRLPKSIAETLLVVARFFRRAALD